VASLTTPPAPAPCAAAPAGLRAAGLHYVTDARPGIRRLRTRAGFRYVDADGRPVRDGATLARIRRLAIPPAWEAVWICPDPHGHLQATGRDARRRKQYRYHPHWTAVRTQGNFARMAAFGRALPVLRRRLAADLARPGLPRERVLALAVELLASTLVRVGNPAYARERGSYGLSTLRTRHVHVKGEQVRFEFTGKSGRVHRLALRDRRTARLLRRCQELPGQALFQYLDGAGERRAVRSEDINAYLHEAMGDAFSAKDFRTWGGSLAATQALLAIAPEHAGRSPEAQMRGAIQAAAARLGNTLAVCRRHYVLPELQSAFAAGELHALWRAARARRHFTRAEVVLLRVCERTAAQSDGTRAARRTIQ
jgi:DNA topoisomerase I